MCVFSCGRISCATKASRLCNVFFLILFGFLFLQQVALLFSTLVQIPVVASGAGPQASDSKKKPGGCVLSRNVLAGSDLWQTVLNPHCAVITV